MGLISNLLLLPLTGPGKGALWVARQVHEAADKEISDPASIRRALRALEVQLEAGEIDEETFEEAEIVLLRRLQPGAA